MLLATDIPLPESPNVLIPASYDVLFGIIAIALILPIIVLVIERRHSGSWTSASLWALVALLLPVVGFAFWIMWVLFTRVRPNIT